MKIYTAMALGFYIYGWYKRASRDGEITQKEMAEGLQGAFELFGIK